MLKLKELKIMKEDKSYKDLVEDYIESCKNYMEYNNLCNERKAHLILDTDWDKINERRKDKGLSKISNQPMKDAYVRLDDVYRELLEMKDLYELKKNYNHYMVQGFLEGDFVNYDELR